MLQLVLNLLDASEVALFAAMDEALGEALQFIPLVADFCRFFG